MHRGRRFAAEVAVGTEPRQAVRAPDEQRLLHLLDHRVVAVLRRRDASQPARRRPLVVGARLQQRLTLKRSGAKLETTSSAGGADRDGRRPARRPLPVAADRMTAVVRLNRVEKTQWSGAISDRKPRRSVDGGIVRLKVAAVGGAIDEVVDVPPHELQQLRGSHRARAVNPSAITTLITILSCVRPSLALTRPPPAVIPEARPDRRDSDDDCAHQRSSGMPGRRRHLRARTRVGPTGSSMRSSERPTAGAWATTGAGARSD